METEINQTNMEAPVCNCNDEFITEPCPVHAMMPDPEMSLYSKDAVVITDADADPAIYGDYATLEGYRFICPKCKVPSIMHNPELAEMCIKCGMKVIIRSKRVTDHLRRMMKQGGNTNGRV